MEMKIEASLQGEGTSRHTITELGNIHARELLLWAIKEVRDTWKQISVFLHDLIETSKVGAEMKRAIFVPSKEDQSTMWQEERSDEPHG